MKSILILLAAVLIILVAIWLLRIYNSKNDGMLDTGSTRTVQMNKLSFQPKDITIQTGDTVNFVNNDKIDHTVTEDNGAFNSGNIQPGQTYSRTFTEVGTVSYHCSIHPEMIGIIRVK